MRPLKCHRFEIERLPLFKKRTFFLGRGLCRPSRSGAEYRFQALYGVGVQTPDNGVDFRDLEAFVFFELGLIWFPYQPRKADRLLVAITQKAHRRVRKTPGGVELDCRTRKLGDVEHSQKRYSRLFGSEWIYPAVSSL